LVCGATAPEEAPLESQDPGAEQHLTDLENPDIPEDSAHAKTADPSSASLSGSSDSLALIAEILIDLKETSG
jgi:hypothetical protein